MSKFYDFVFVVNNLLLLKLDACNSNYLNLLFDFSDIKYDKSYSTLCIFGILLMLNIN